MSTWGSEGIVLKRSDFGEADKLLTIFTKNKGKIRALAKGIRRVSSRRAGNVELLNHSKLFFSESKNFNILTEATTISSFQTLKEDLEKISYGYKIAEIIDRLFDSEQEARGSFGLLLEALERINSAQDLGQAQLFRSAFEIKILDKAGFRPQLFVCTKCTRPLQAESQRLSPGMGGLLDKNCSSESLARPVSVEAIKILRFLLEEDWEQIKKLSIPKLLQKEIDQHLGFYLEYIVEANLASEEFIDQVKNL
ncbi:MAG: DNA repair protein RecO [bacterium]|nr:DNA repair protein RecO [bacterium]